MGEIFRVYRDPSLIRRLKALLRGGADGAEAAGHAEAIINRLIDDGIRDPKLMGRLTRNGEARIKNCVKFDLVKGYRLVGVLRKGGIAFVYVGSHDGCDRWVKNNAGLEPVLNKKSTEVEEATEAAPPEGGPETGEPEPDYDELLLKNLTEQDLIKIFPGLCGRK